MKTHLETITSICANMEALQKKAESEYGLWCRKQDIIAEKLKASISESESLTSDIAEALTDIEARADNISSILKEIKNNNEKLDELKSALTSDIEALTSEIKARAYITISILKAIKNNNEKLDELKSEMNHEEIMKRINAQKQLTNK